MAIDHTWDELRPELAAMNLLDRAVERERRCLAPKGASGFRVVTQLDPIDGIVVGALVREIGEDLEASRVPTDQDRVFSWRYDPEDNGRMFSVETNYSKFIQVAEEKCKQYSHIGKTDIADFYPRIYHHRLEDALKESTDKQSHVGAILKITKNLTAHVSHGIPIAGDAFRLLAEVTLNNVDQSLLSEQIDFVRFNDDYLIFGDSHADCFRKIAKLAAFLYELQGLTLQPSKTHIYEAETYSRRFLVTPTRREIQEKRKSILVLLMKLGFEDLYDLPSYEDLDEESQRSIDSLNLVEMFQSELDEDHPDGALLGFILRRMSSLDRPDLVDPVLEHTEKIHYVFPDIIRYLKSLTLDPPEKKRIGEELIGLLDESVLGVLEYYRMWLFSLFADSSDWNHEGMLVTLLGRYSDSFSKRELILAIGAAGQDEWFMANRRFAFDLPKWSERAFLAGARCLASDPRRHWYQAVAERLDRLEQCVVEWAY